MIPRARPYLGAAEMLAALKPGEARPRFEAAVAKMAGARYALAFSFAHSAFYALLKVMDLQQAEIVLPAYTCDIMAEVVVATDNIPVFVDIDLADFNMNRQNLRRTLSSKTRALVATHMFGYPIDVESIRQMIGSDQILLVEDSALALNRSSHLRGDAGLFSFGPGKPLYTVRGGVCVTNDATLFERLYDYRERYMSTLPVKEWAKRWMRLVVSYLSQTDTGYGFTARLGLIKENMERGETRLPESYATAYADFQARVGLGLLDKADFLVSQRWGIAALYGKKLQSVPGINPAPVVKEGAFTLYSARVKNRDAFQFAEKMHRRGIQTGRTFDYAIPNLDKYRRFAKGSYPQAEIAAREVVNLPLHTNLGSRQIDRIVESARAVLEECR